MYIHERENWYNFVWDNEKILPLLASVRHLQGRLLGHMERLGFDLIERATLESLILDVIDTSKIEGEFLNPELVRSSIARKLGIEVPNLYLHHEILRVLLMFFWMQLRIMINIFLMNDFLVGTTHFFNQVTVDM